MSNLGFYGMIASVLYDAAAWCGIGVVAYSLLYVCRKRHPLLDDAERRRTLASQTLSMTHAVGGVGLATYLLLYACPHWTIVNAPLQTALAHFSLGYFACDTLYMLVYDRDPLFLMHHAAGMGITAVTAFSGVGGYYFTLGLFLGELSNPVQIVWSAARQYGYTRLYATLTPYFTHLFLGLRLGAIPAVAGCVVWHGAQQEELPLVHKVTMASLMTGITVGGWAWGWSLWTGYCRFCAKQEQEKGRRTLNVDH